MQMRSNEDHAAMLEAAKAWSRIKRATQRLWADWTTKVGPALVLARTEAMAIAGTNQPQGKNYSAAMSALLQTYALDDMEKSIRKDLMDIMENLVAFNDWRDKQPIPTALNHPTTVWRKFQSSGAYKAILMERGDYRPPNLAQSRRSREPNLLEEVAAKDELIEDLKGQLQEAIEERDSLRVQLETMRKELVRQRAEMPDLPDFLDRNKAKPPER
jgi:hypothetical protein